MPRQKLPAETRKSELLQLRTTTEERAVLVAAAAAAKMTFSEWALSILLEAAGKPPGAQIDLGSKIDEGLDLETPLRRMTFDWVLALLIEATARMRAQIALESKIELDPALESSPKKRAKVKLETPEKASAKSKPKGKTPRTPKSPGTGAKRSARARKG